VIVSVSVHCRTADDFSVRLEAVPPHESNHDPYYRLRLGWDLTLYLSDAQCLQLMDALSSRPPLASIDEQPEPDADCYVSQAERCPPRE
jgi:hypothetical protein